MGLPEDMDGDNELDMKKKRMGSNIPTFSFLSVIIIQLSYIIIIRS